MFKLYLATMGDDYQAWLKYLDALISLGLKDKAVLVYKLLVQMFGLTAELDEYQF